MAYVKAEYDKKFNRKPSQRKKRAELNRYNREKKADYRDERDF